MAWPGLELDAPVSAFPCDFSAFSVPFQCLSVPVSAFLCVFSAFPCVFSAFSVPFQCLSVRVGGGRTRVIMAATWHQVGVPTVPASFEAKSGPPFLPQTNTRAA